MHSESELLPNIPNTPSNNSIYQSTMDDCTIIRENWGSYRLHYMEKALFRGGDRPCHGMGPDNYLPNEPQISLWARELCIIIYIPCKHTDKSAKPEDKPNFQKVSYWTSRLFLSAKQEGG